MADKLGLSQHEVDQEQAILDLEQLFADHHQARVDRDQTPVDDAQHVLDAEVAGAAGDGLCSDISVDLRQMRIADAQHRSDSVQAEIDERQRAHLARQIRLDGQQTTLDHAGAVEFVGRLRLLPVLPVCSDTASRQLALAARRSATSTRETDGLFRRRTARSRAATSAWRSAGRARRQEAARVRYADGCSPVDGMLPRGAPLLRVGP